MKYVSYWSCSCLYYHNDKSNLSAVGVKNSLLNGLSDEEAPKIGLMRVPQFSCCDELNVAIGCTGRGRREVWAQTS